VLRVEPEIIANDVAAGAVSLALHPMLDHGDASNLTHRTAECAGVQSPLAFWQMHNLLFERQSDHWRADDSVMLQLGSELGLDTGALSTCINEPATQEKIARMDQQRRDEGIRLRPTFNINENRVEGALPYAQLQQKFAAVVAE
jgi:protein-disulfide isomerase